MTRIGEECRPNGCRALAAIDLPTVHTLIRKHLLEGQSTTRSYGRWIGRVTAANGAVLKSLKSDAVLRVRKLLVADIEEPSTRGVTRLSHPATRLAAMISGLGEEALLKDYQAFAEATIQRYPYASPILDELSGAPKLRLKLIEIWLKNAGSSTFDTANAFAAAAPQNDDYAETLLTDESALRLIIGIIQAAEWNARRAKTLRSERFASTPRMREMALRHANKKPKASAALVAKALPDTLLADFLTDELA